MKRLYTILALIVFTGTTAQTQDLALSGVLSPAAGGCNVCNPVLTVTIQNACGVPIGTAFNVSYSINGGPAHTENISTFIGSCVSYTYSFITNPLFVHKEFTTYL